MFWKHFFNIERGVKIRFCLFVVRFIFRMSGFVKNPQKEGFYQEKQGGLHHATHASHSAHATHIRHCRGRFFFFDFMHGGFCG